MRTRRRLTELFTQGANRVTTPQYTRQSEFWAGFRATIPLVIGALPFGLIFAALATATHIPPLVTIGMSALIFAGSAQFIAVKLLAAGATAPLVILTIAVVNLRHMLYGMTMGPHVKRLPQRWLALLGFLMTDEAFVTSIQRYERDDDSPFKHWYFFGSGMAIYVFWNLMTIIGIFAGSLIPESWGLDFALDVTFIGMLIPMARQRPALVAALAAGVTALLAHSLPNQLGLIVAALVGVAAGVIAESAVGRTPDDTLTETSQSPQSPMEGPQP
jgi:4-azaleucine resistance transporter AzlC